ACLVDQLLGQYMAHVVSLGHLLEPAHVKTTLESIYRYNYRQDLLEHEAVQRIYAVNDDGGVLIATYPSGKRPEIPFPYFTEIWTGPEYQFAAHLIYEGMLDEALTVIETARRRHDGERRNPWNEPECGHHYARAMSSWAVILALNGFHYAGPEKKVILTPRTRGSNLRSFWMLPSGWGSFSHSTSAATQTSEITAIEGKLALGSLVLGSEGKTRAAVRLGEEAVKVKVGREGNFGRITFGRELEISPGQPLTVTLGA
ncbi:MAG: hypothetical protein HY508_04635, partial [Acidobacteria bacterium]|nr:hypothetical protein [Acidobacteriota bacterium]